MNYKTACPLCGGHIEFEAVHLGRTAPCPHCKGEIVLTTGEEGGMGADAGPQVQEVREAPPAWNVFARVFYNMEQKQLEQTRLVGQRQSRIEATMAQVRNGTWQVQVDGLVLSTGERALWRQAAAAVDPDVIDKPEQGSAYGVTTKIFKSITTRLTQPPSKIAAAKALPTSAPLPGEFIVTNCRLVFTSKVKTSITRFENLVDVVSTLEGIKYSEKGKPTVYGIKYDQPNGDIITQMIDYGLEMAGQR